MYTISATVGFIGASALRARYSLAYGFSGPLPDNQWQLEAESWITGALASLQDVFVEAANGIPEALEDFRQPPPANETVTLNLCANQKIVSNGYSSFNVLGLSLILILGVAIIILDIGLEPTIAWYQSRKYRKYQLQDQSYGRDEKVAHPLYGAIEWSQTSIMQLQRMAHEESGYGDWSNCNRDVPVTEPGQLIASLDLRKVNHPSLKQKEISSSPGWDNVATFKPWGVRRSETGMDTLVGVVMDEKEAKDRQEDIPEVPPVFHAVSERGKEAEMVDAQMRATTRPKGEGQNWRALR